MITRWSIIFGALILSGCVASPHSTDIYGYSGVRAYQTLCANCHGLTGHGDGPLQPMVHSVPDLTQIAQRRGGTFPASEIQRIIDGRTTLDAHGTRTMPVWGWELDGASDSTQEERERARRTLKRIVKYLETIQTTGK